MNSVIMWQTISRLFFPILITSCDSGLAQDAPRPASTPSNRRTPEPNSQERKSNYQHSACTCREGVEAESWPGKSLGRMDPSDETTGVTDAGMDDLLLLGRLEPNPIIPILSAFNCRLLAPNSR